MEFEEVKTGQPEGVRFYLNGQHWDGTLSDEADPERLDSVPELPKPGEPVTLELKIGPEFAVVIHEKIIPAFQKIAQALLDIAKRLVDWASEAIQRLANRVQNYAHDLMDSLLYHANDHPKWWHLYKHAKKARTRKKYRRLLMRQLLGKVKAAAAA